jgi:hypothetical protein
MHLKVSESLGLVWSHESGHLSSSLTAAAAARALPKLVWWAKNYRAEVITVAISRAVSDSVLYEVPRMRARAGFGIGLVLQLIEPVGQEQPPAPPIALVPVCVL